MSRTLLGADVRSDAELIAASSTDPQAFRGLYDRWAEPMLQYFARRVYDAEIAADLTAETFAVAYERRQHFRDIGRPGGAWLYGIAGKELSRFFRRREVELRVARRLGLERPALDQESELRIAALIDGDEHRARIAAALERLPGTARRAVELRVVEELSYEQIAERLGPRRSRFESRSQRLSAKSVSRSTHALARAFSSRAS
jgi:RNA polymerase sigma factor (sigma-70 family)